MEINNNYREQFLLKGELERIRAMDLINYSKKYDRTVIYDLTNIGEQGVLLCCARLTRPKINLMIKVLSEMSTIYDD